MKNEFDYLNDVRIDFSAYEENPLTEKEYTMMKKAVKTRKKISMKKCALIAACICAVAAVTTVSYGSEFFGKFIKSVSTGHNQFALYDTSGAEVPLPKELNGLLFDENGNKIKYFTDNQKYFDKDGNEITDFDEYLISMGVTEITTNSEKVLLTPKNGSDPLDNARKEGYPIIYDEAKINDYLCFNAKLPQYLPDGYSFYGASAYGDEYLFVYYKNNENGNYIMLDERIINDETAFSTGTDGSIEETEIHGQKAVITDNSSIDWEEGGISIGISGRRIISLEELIKISESVE